MKIAISLAALLAAYGQQAAPPAANEVSEPTPIVGPAPPTAKAFIYDEENDLIEYHYAWSAEVAAVPQLVEWLRATIDKDRVDLLANARTDKASHDKMGDPFKAYGSSVDFATAGQSPRLLSLSISSRRARDNFDTSALLWDRQAARQISIAELFAESASMDRLASQRWCDALKKAWNEKPGETDSGGTFDKCLTFLFLDLVPTDKDKNGRFERLILSGAGPDDEASYEIDLVVTPDLIAALKSDYRDSFEVGQAQ